MYIIEEWGQVWQLEIIQRLKLELDVSVLLFWHQDAKPLEVYSIEFMVDNNQLGFLGKISKKPSKENSVSARLPLIDLFFSF